MPFPELERPTAFLLHTIGTAIVLPFAASDRTAAPDSESHTRVHNMRGKCRSLSRERWQVMFVLLAFLISHGIRACPFGWKGATELAFPKSRYTGLPFRDGRKVFAFLTLRSKGLPFRDGHAVSCGGTCGFMRFHHSGETSFSRRDTASPHACGDPRKRPAHAQVVM